VRTAGGGGGSEAVSKERGPVNPTTGFAIGDRVTMISGVSGERVYGRVEKWQYQAGQIVSWDDTGLVTALPNPNVELADGRGS
jgi:hypothetical protein